MRRAVLILVCSCVGTVGGVPGPDSGTPPGEDAGTDAGSATDAGHDAGTPDAGAPDAGTPDAGVPDAGPADGGDLCAGAKLCETFESYDAGSLPDGKVFGPWRVNVQDSNGSADIDTTRSVSGTRALHVHIEQGQSSGAQIRTRAAPLFAQTRQQLYGRFMMYLGPDGTSIHWTMFGMSGIVPAGTTSAGATATYLFSAFDNGQGKNEYSEVYGNSSTGQDCYHGSSVLMPVNTWTCVAFSVDAPNRTYRFWLNGVSRPELSINDKGDGCVTPPNQSWWGPDFDELYMGALSFHPMSGPLDLWIDDLVVDTSPVPLMCP